MVKKICVQGSCLLVAWLLTACASNRDLSATVNQPGIAPITARVHALPGAPVRPVKPLQPIFRRDSQGFVSVQIPVSNPASSPRNFRYSWEWVGPDGVSSENPARATWRFGLAEPKDTFPLQSTSTVTDPAGVILRLSQATP
jgi:hypothetical protein